MLLSLGSSNPAKYSAASIHLVAGMLQIWSWSRDKDWNTFDHQTILQTAVIFETGWWFGTFFIIPYIGIVIIPTDKLIFYRGLVYHQPVFFPLDTLDKNQTIPAAMAFQTLCHYPPFFKGCSICKFFADKAPWHMTIITTSAFRMVPPGNSNVMIKRAPRWTNEWMMIDPIRKKQG